MYGYPPIHIYHGKSGVHGEGHGHGGGGGTVSQPTGLSPQTIKSVYNISGTSTGTIALIDAYADPNIQGDLNTFDAEYGLPACATGCLEVHPMAPRLRGNTGWGLEKSLDVEWAHALAPGAHILLVEAKSSSGSDLLAAVNYAAQRSDVVAVSMSWGSNEFAGEQSYDSYFTSPHGAAFFAAAGDSGAGAEWPAVSPNVTGVGGTTLALNASGTVSSETAWSGSGGGLSAYELEPSYQHAYDVPQANGMRATPDVSFDANPNSGVSVYDSYGYGGWLQVGGTSVGAPSWAAIHAIGANADNPSLYADAANMTLYALDFRDITGGTNGSCGFYCTAQTGYDYVTGLGSPLTTAF